MEKVDANYDKFRRDFAVRVEGVLDLPPGNTSLRISCPGDGGLFLGSELVFSSSAVPGPAAMVCFYHPDPLCTL